ncbi:hypothetical protein [Paenibacillus sp. S28]|uniref:hypothetical protein n=1 Tax=Paenibacillus sp. S28 TaxID=2767463 RepID=UPI001F3EDFAD|nr:hypothetical protein [Paenibacillus sp. S28]
MGESGLEGLFGCTPVALNTEPGYFPAIYTITSIWKSFGWSSILYLAAMSSMNLHQYEAAKMDGPKKGRKAAGRTVGISFREVVGGGRNPGGMLEA